MVSSCVCQGLQSDASLRPFLDAYGKRCEDAKNTVNALKLRVVPPTPPRAKKGKGGGKGKGKGDDVGDDDDEGDDEDGNENDDGDTFVPCAICGAPETAR